jgi:hypothetical protein
VLLDLKDQLVKQQNDSAMGELKLEDGGGEKWRWARQGKLFIGERGRADVGLHPYPHLQPNRRSAQVCYEFGSVLITPLFRFFTPKSSRFVGRGQVGTGTGCT